MEALLGQKFPRISHKDPLVYPKFGHFPNLGECDLERYARVYTLIRYIGHVANEGIFKGRYGSSHWAAETSVGSTHVPQWMAPRTPISDPLPPDAPTTPLALSRTEKPTITLQITWRYNSRLEQPTAYRDYVKDEGPDLEGLLPNFSQTIKIEPEASREHFVDSVRIAYKMDSIQANIHGLQLVLRSTKEEEEEEEEEEEQRFNVTTTDWSIVQHAL